MSVIYKTGKILILLVLGLVLLLAGLTMPRWPSRARLCRDVADFLPPAECRQLNSALEIVQAAFPAGAVSAAEVRSALGDYLVTAVPTTYGHREVYHLERRPIDYLFNYFATYDFRYDQEGQLVSFSYDDF